LETIHIEAYRRVIDELVAGRKAIGMNQEQLAKAWGRSQTTIARIESYSRRIDVVELITLCEILILDAVDIVSRLKNDIKHRK